MSRIAVSDATKASRWHSLTFFQHTFPSFAHSLPTDE